MRSLLRWAVVALGIGLLGDFLGGMMVNYGKRHYEPMVLIYGGNHASKHGESR